MSAALQTRIQARLLAEAPEVVEVASRWERRVRVRETVARFLAEERISLARRTRSPRSCANYPTRSVASVRWSHCCMTRR